MTYGASVSPPSGVNSTTTDPMELPIGLVGAIDEQLDIVSVVGLPTVEFFENTSWLPTYSLLVGATADASRTAGDAALVRADLSEATAIFSGTDAQREATAEVTPGVVHVAVPFDENWRLEVDGESIPARRAFGVTTAFDVERGGVATLSYQTAGTRSLALLVQLLLWAAVVFAATRVTVPLARRRGPLVSDETLISIDEERDLDAEFEAEFNAAIGATVLDPGLDMTDQIARVDADEALTAADPIDELPWVDELMDESIIDPVAVSDDPDVDGAPTAGDDR